jgi:predicted secreted protein
MTAGSSAFGTELKIGDGATSETFTTIAEVVTITGPSLAMDPLEMTNHDSPGQWEEHIGGTLRSGEVTFDLNYIPADGTHDASTGLLADFLARTVRNFELIFSDTPLTKWSFSAFVTGFEPSAPFDDKLSASVTLKVTGQPTLA